MNTFQTTLYQQLMAATTAASEAFFFNDHVRDGVTYRIFSYRLASYTDFCLPSALECRGSMFRMGEDGQPEELVSLPFEKFFNDKENFFTQGIDYSTRTKRVTTKADGSGISTYMHEGRLALKSKASLSSVQALAAEAFLTKPENANFAEELGALARAGITVIMEWVSPANRIVLPYATDSLIVLALRNNRDGLYIHLREPTLEVVRRATATQQPEDITAFIASIPAMENIEGFVVVLDNEQKVKMKTEWYLVRHRVKDSISHPRHLFTAIISEAVDDVKTLFAGDSITLDTIARMEQLIIPQYNAMMAGVEDFHATHKDLSRKDYALAAQALDDGYMSLYMNAYLGRDIGYREFAIKHYEDFGVKDFQMNVNAGEEA